MTDLREKINWLEDNEIPKCVKCGQKLPYVTCVLCQYSMRLRTIEQSFSETWICNFLLQNNLITCEIEDTSKAVVCPHFEVVEIVNSVEEFFAEENKGKKVRIEIG